MRKDNLERLWQNHFLDKFAERGADGKLTVDYTQVETKKLFVGQLMTFIDEGLGHEAKFSVEQLSRLAQPSTLEDKLPIPNIVQYDEAVDVIRKNRGGLTPEQEYYLNEIREFIANENARGAGARDSTILGLKERFSEDNRQNRYKAETQTYVWEFKDRYRGVNENAKPWNIVKNNWLKYNFLARPAHFLKGGLDIKPGESMNWGRATDDYSKEGIEKTMKTDAETNWAPIRRSLLRTSTGGLINDAGKDVRFFIKPTKLGWAALGSAGLWGAGEAFGSETTSDVGRVGTTVFTTPVQTLYGYGPIVDFITGFSDEDPSVEPKEGEENNNAPVVTRPSAMDMDGAKDLSEDNIDAIEELREKITLEFDEHIAALNEYQVQATGALTDLRRYSVSKGETDKVAEYTALQQQLNTAVSDMRAELYKDKDQLSLEGDNALKEAQNLDDFIQDGSSLKVAQQRLDEQTALIVQHANLASVLSAHRVAGLNNMAATFDAAIDQAKKLDEVIDTPSYEEVVKEQKEETGSKPAAEADAPAAEEDEDAPTAEEDDDAPAAEEDENDPRPAGLKKEISAANAASGKILAAINGIKSDLEELDERQSIAQNAIDRAKELEAEYSEQKFTEYLPYMESYVQEIKDRREDLKEAQEAIVRDATDANKLIKATAKLETDADIATAQANNKAITELTEKITIASKAQEQKTDAFNKEFDPVENPALDYYIGSGMRVDEGLLKAGGGPQGVMYQTFGSGGANIQSVAEGWWKTAAGGIGSLTSSWERMKRDAARYGSQGEQNTLNWMENGAMAIGLIWAGKHALNFAGIDNGLARGALLVGIIGFALHRTGITGKEMHDWGKPDVRQSEYGSRLASTPTSAIDTSNIPATKTNAAEGSSAQPTEGDVIYIDDPSSIMNQSESGNTPELYAVNDIETSAVVTGNQNSLPTSLQKVNIDQVIGYESMQVANDSIHAMTA